VPRAVKVSREEQLLGNAIQLFSRGGFRETSLQEIAVELGITRPLFYYYFESKEELLWRIIGHLGDVLLEQARPIATADRTPRERLRALLEMHIETLLANVDAFRIYFAERHSLTGKRDLRLKRGELAYQHLITDVIVEGQRAGEFVLRDPELLERMSLGAANALLRWYVPTGAIPPQDITVAMVEFILAGIKA
jgi:AcrR family transcriptional regulator